jgi:hypothetical protein
MIGEKYILGYRQESMKKESSALSFLRSYMELHDLMYKYMQLDDKCSTLV